MTVANTVYWPAARAESSMSVPPEVCYLLAYAKESGSVLVTFDKALIEVARKHDYAAIVPA